MAIVYEGIAHTDPNYKASMMVCPCGASALYVSPGALPHSFDSAQMEAAMHDKSHRRSVWVDGVEQVLEHTVTVYSFKKGSPFPDHLVTPKTKFLIIQTFS